MSKEQDKVLMAHGGGGEMMCQLLEGHVFSKLSNEYLDRQTDSAVFEAGGSKVCMTTDGFVVVPLEFGGGDIGRLAVCGTVNDLSVMGARPIMLSLGLIIEEGLSMSMLDKIMDSVSETAREAGVVIGTGDTKVVERSRGDGITITTAGIGLIDCGCNIDYGRVEAGDVLIVTGNIADHGLAVMAAREGLGVETSVKSDAAPLNGLTGSLFEAGCDIKFMRDPTRGGVATVFADLSEMTGLSVEIWEERVPVSPESFNLCELLGLDPLTVANEGKIVMAVSRDESEKVLEVCRGHNYGRDAAVIGRFTDSKPVLVELLTKAGGKRIVQRPYGEQLPRIC